MLRIVQRAAQSEVTAVGQLLCPGRNIAGRKSLPGAVHAGHQIPDPALRVAGRQSLRRIHRPGVIAVISGVADQPQPDLLEIVDAEDRLRPVARLVQRRQQHRRENRDDRNHDEEFDQSKIPPFVSTKTFPSQHLRSPVPHCGKLGPSPGVAVHLVTLYRKQKWKAIPLLEKP